MWKNVEKRIQDENFPMALLYEFVPIISMFYFAGVLFPNSSTFAN
jgi:hypothetical protein